MDTLDLLGEGDTGKVLSVRSSGAVRSRLQDIGLIPGTSVTCVRIGTGIAAYRIRGAVIALRTQEAQHVCMTRSNPAGKSFFLPSR